MQSPIFLSILIPTWNRCAQLEARLRSILPNLGDDLELVISDNGSTDETEAMVRRTIQLHPHARIRYLRSSTNRGADANLRTVLQAGEGTWLWPVSDDDHINFALPATLRATLEKCPCRLCLLQDADPGGPRPPELLKGADFLERYVASTVDLLQIGRVICRRDLVVAVDAESWQRQEHNLHSHLAPYARGILDDGILLLQCSPFERPLERTFPRWDLLDGQLGAWRASLIAFPDHHAIVNRREQVIREPCVFHAFGYRIIVGKAIAAQDWTFAFRVVSGRTRLKLLVLLVLSGVQPETRRRWLPRLFPRNRVLPQYIERHKTDQQARHRGAPDPSLIPPATAGTSHSGSIHG